jgi:hypothetical protein
VLYDSCLDKVGHDEDFSTEKDLSCWADALLDDILDNCEEEIQWLPYRDPVPGTWGTAK